MTRTSRWYQQPVMWLVVAVPSAAVIFGIVMISLALNSDDGLVVDDYYKKGLEINRSLERDKTAAQWGISARITLNDPQGKVFVDMHWPLPSALPQDLKLIFLNATRGGLDRELMLSNIGGSRYQAELPKLGPGRWYIRLSTPSWRIQKVVELPLTGQLLLTADKRAAK